MFFLVNLFIVSGQDEIEWSVDFNESTEEVKMRADLANGWHLYSSQKVYEFGPIPVSFQFDKTNDVELVDEVIEPKAVIILDPNFNSELAVFNGNPEFIQKVKVLNPSVVQLIISYMICDDTKCLPPTDEVFNIQLSKSR